MELPHRLIAILDARDFKKFCHAFNDRIIGEGAGWFSCLLSSDASAEGFDRVEALAWFIFVERQGRHFGEPKHFELTPTLEAIQELIYKFSAFRNIDVPFEVWKSAFSEGQRIIREMIDEDSDLRVDPRRLVVEEFVAKQMQIVLKDPGYADKYCNLLNGAR